MDRLLSSDAYLNLRFRLGLKILFGHLITSFLLVLTLKFVIRKPGLYLKSSHQPTLSPFCGRTCLHKFNKSKFMRVFLSIWKHSWSLGISLIFFCSNVHTISSICICNFYQCSLTFSLLFKNFNRVSDWNSVIVLF